MSLESDNQAMFAELSSSFDRELDTTEITTGFSPIDLANMASFANCDHNLPLLQLLQDVANEQQAAADSSVEARSYKLASQLISSMLYTRGDPSITEAPATLVEAFTLLSDETLPQATV